MDVIYEIPAQSFEKLPTLNQWLKTKASAKLKNRYHVTKIWFPGNYANITLEVEYFRVLVYENSPLFDGIVELARKIASVDQAIALVVADRRDGGFAIVGTSEKGVWEPIGDKGVKWVFSIPKTTPRAS